MEDYQNPKVALVVDYLNQYGGAERLLEALLRIYPQSDIYTSLYDRSKIPDGSNIHQSRVITSPLNLVPLVSALSKYFTFIYPLIFSKFDLSGYDLIISSGSIWSKGVKKNSSQLHIYYCHTPPRFLYGYPSESSRRNRWYYRPFVYILDHLLRVWDFKSAQNPDIVVSNSENVKRRIGKYYRRQAQVIYPPVSFQDNLDKHGNSRGRFNQGEYYLIVSRLSAYKNIDVAVCAFNQLKLNLKIVGVGREEKWLKKLAGSNIEFLGFLRDDDLADAYRNCQAFIYTTEDEDFGITPLEANFFGKPVIALKSGGIIETMIEGKTALFFGELTVNSLVCAVLRFRERREAWNSRLIRDNANRFTEDRFKKEFISLIESKLSDFLRTSNVR